MPCTTDPVRPRKPRTSNFIEKAIAEGKPLPLEVILDSMWRFLDQAQRLESSGDPDDAMLARIARDRAYRVAKVAAPYLHPRMAATSVADTEDDEPVHVPHENRFADLSEAEATRFLDAIAAGEMTIEQVYAELDSPAPIPANVPPNDSVTVLLRALFEALTEGRFDTPQQRLAALHAKARRDRFLNALPLAELSKVYFRLIAGEDLEVILPDYSTTP